MPSLLDPQNLVFLAPFAAGLLLAILTMATGAMHGAHGHAGHGHLGHGHVGHAHGMAHAAHGHAAPAHAAAGHGSSHAHAAAHPHANNGAAKSAAREAPAGGISLGSVFGAVTGLNQAPITVLLWTFLIGWGFCGFWSRYLFHVPLELALLIAGGGGYVIARSAAVLVSRMIPPDTTSAVSRPQLLGSTGHAVYPITDTGGRVHVYDAFGTLHAESCRLENGQSPIEKGCEVLLIDYDDQRRVFLVERLSPAAVTAAEIARSEE